MNLSSREVDYSSSVRCGWGMKWFGETWNETALHRERLYADIHPIAHLIATLLIEIGWLFTLRFESLYCWTDVILSLPVLAPSCHPAHLFCSYEQVPTNIHLIITFSSTIRPWHHSPTAWACLASVGGLTVFFVIGSRPMDFSGGFTGGGELPATMEAECVSTYKHHVCLPTHTQNHARVVKIIPIHASSVDSERITWFTVIVDGIFLSNVLNMYIWSNKNWFTWVET